MKKYTNNLKINEPNKQGILFKIICYACKILIIVIPQSSMISMKRSEEQVSVNKEPLLISKGSFFIENIF